MIFTDDAHLQERLAYWQGVLRLQDWDVCAKIAAPNEIQDRAWGTNNYGRGSGESYIRISSCEADADGDPHDQENTLVHELLHLKYATLDRHVVKDDESLEFKEFERAIDQTAKALVFLDRR